MEINNQITKTEGRKVFIELLRALPFFCFDHRKVALEIFFLNLKILKMCKNIVIIILIS